MNLAKQPRILISALVLANVASQPAFAADHVQSKTANQQNSAPKSGLVSDSRPSKSDATSLEHRIQAELEKARISETAQDLKGAEAHLKKALDLDKQLSRIECKEGEPQKTANTADIIERLLNIYEKQKAWVVASGLCQGEGLRIWSPNIAREKNISIIMAAEDYKTAKANLKPWIAQIAACGEPKDKETEDLYRRLKVMLETCEKETPPPTGNELLAIELTEKGRAEFYKPSANLAEAESLFKRAFELNKPYVERLKTKKFIPPENPHNQIISFLLEIYKRQKRFAEAEALLRTEGTTVWIPSNVDLQLAKILMAQGKYHEAWQYLRQFDPPKPPTPGGFCGNPYMEYVSMKNLITTCKKGMDTEDHHRLTEKETSSEP